MCRFSVYIFLIFSLAFIFNLPNSMRTHFIENDDLLILVVPLRFKFLTCRICCIKLFTVFFYFVLFSFIKNWTSGRHTKTTARACCSWRHSMPIVGVRLVRLLLLFRWSVVVVACILAKTDLAQLSVCRS